MQRKQIPFSIENSDIPTIVSLSHQIPEFDTPYEPAVYEQRLNDKPHLVLAAYSEGQAVGFKLGYACDGYFYSWMGGVLPAFRKMGIAQALADEQHHWARLQGFSRVRFKTRNYLRAMLHFGIANGFHIIEVIPKDTIEQYRIVFEKDL